MAEFLGHLYTPSAIMRWLLILLPASILISGLSGWVEKERGNRRLTAFAALVTVWVWLPISFALPQMAQLSAVVTILLWFWLVGAWGHHVWTMRPTPIWAHALVISHLVAIFIAAIVALVRATLRTLS